MDHIHTLGLIDLQEIQNICIPGTVWACVQVTCDFLQLTSKNSAKGISPPGPPRISFFIFSTPTTSSPTTLLKKYNLHHPPTHSHTPTHTHTHTLEVLVRPPSERCSVRDSRREHDGPLRLHILLVEGHRIGDVAESLYLSLHRPVRS